MDRREFLMSSAAAVSAPLAAQGRRLRMALVGTGERGIQTWGKPGCGGRPRAGFHPFALFQGIDGLGQGFLGLKRGRLIHGFDVETSSLFT